VVVDALGSSGAPIPGGVERVARWRLAAASEPSRWGRTCIHGTEDGTAVAWVRSARSWTAASDVHFVASPTSRRQMRILCDLPALRQQRAVQVSGFWLGVLVLVALALISRA
jgi:hypothetical protein